MIPSVDRLPGFYGLDDLPSLTALCLVHAEPVEHVVAILEGYKNLRVAASRILREIFLCPSDEVLHEHAGSRPYIAAVLDERSTQGARGNQVRDYCRANNVSVLPYSTFPLPFTGKNQLLGMALPHLKSSWVIVADVGISRDVAEQVLRFFPAIAVDPDSIYVWEGKGRKGDRELQIVITHESLLNSGKALDSDNDLYEIAKREAWFGGLRVRPWGPPLQPRKYKLTRSPGRAATFHQLVNSFLFQAARKGIRVAYAVL